MQDGRWCAQRTAGVPLIVHLVHLVMGQATQRQHVDIDRISFIDALRWLAAARDDEFLSTLVVNPCRPSPDEPRVRKRWPLLDFVQFHGSHRPLAPGASGPILGFVQGRGRAMMLNN
jgi:hypothetical protein